MHESRASHNLVVLPDGKVLAVGGSDTMSPSSGQSLPAEIWDPASQAWTELSSMAVARRYHSTATLMTDGRVLSTGGGQWLPGTPGEFTAQYFSPGYLFKGARPTITSAPATSSYGASMTIGTPDAATIGSVALVALPSSTHTQDWNQRYVPLSFSASPGALSVQAPSGSTIAPPGVYMLLIVNQNGVPSVGKIFSIGTNGSIVFISSRKVSPRAPKVVLTRSGSKGSGPGGNTLVAHEAVVPQIGRRDTKARLAAIASPTFFCAIAQPPPESST
jgi:hypothetical protein